MTENDAIRRHRQRGVSLVEILIVLMIAAMVAGVVVLNAPPGRGDAQKEAEIFAARLQHKAEEAVTTGSLIGMDVSESGYEFYRYVRGQWIEWSAAEDTARSFPAEFAVDVNLLEPAKKNESETVRRAEDETEQPKPNVFFAPTGETTPLQVLFHEREESFYVRLDGAGNVKFGAGGDDA